MRITAKVDYAVRACVELAHRYALDSREPTTAEKLGAHQNIPKKYLENILTELRKAKIVSSQRGPIGGYWLTRDPSTITVADVIRAVEGPLADVRGVAPEELQYEGAAVALERVWIATRASLRSVLEGVSLADIATGSLPESLEALLQSPGAWERR
ncbi:MAG: Rrf2 family transcriptional regulator [Microthrixaceae bacterium]